MAKTAVKVENVSVMFNLNKEKVDNIKEYLIKMVKRELRFTEFWALTDVSFEVAEGERLGILGFNGAGKSTFLNLMTGDLQADSGTIEHGQTLRIGYYRQSGISFKAGQTVFDVVHDIAETVEAADGHSVSATTMLNRFLFPPDTLNKRVDILSGGEQRRLYLLTVLMCVSLTSAICVKISALSVRKRIFLTEPSVRTYCMQSRMQRRKS